MTVVEAQALSRTFGHFTAVDSVTLAIQKSEIVGLLGANGAGKTTLIRMLLGLLNPSSGHVRVFGKRPSREQRRRMGYVPQDLGLYTDLSVAENLQFRAEVFGSQPPDTGSDGDVGTPLFGALNLGAQRRAAFAAATQHHPELLVLDEPTSGVSPLTRSKLWDLIHQQADSGTAVLVSTHYMDEAEQADRLLIMSAGRVVAAGTTEEVVAGREVVSVSSEHWQEVFRLLGHHDYPLRLYRRDVRVLGTTVETIRSIVDRAGIPAIVGLKSMTLEEVLIELDTKSEGKATR